MSYKTQEGNKVLRRKLFKLHAKHQEELKYKKNMMIVAAQTRGQKKHSEHNYTPFLMNFSLIFMKYPERGYWVSIAK